MNSSNTQYSALCCYFGQWPSYFQLWLNSCRYNQAITFFLVTDISTEGYDVPENVHVVMMSFEEVRTLVQQKFPELKVSVDRPYKLCDFKTAYGHIFSHLFEGYAYWGFYDIDTIWGDICKFIPENADNQWVRIFPCGHLSFIRNEAPWHHIYELVNEVAGTPCRNNMEGKQVATWQECFSSPMSHYYDEEGGLEPLLSHLGVAQYGAVDFDNIMPPWRFNHFLCINFPEKSNHLVYSFEQGHLYRHYLHEKQIVREEISYLHISKRQMQVCTYDRERFIIYPNRFAAWKPWTLCRIRLHGRKRFLGHFIQRIINRISK
ncbi:MAG: hypothetical protein Q4B58_06210 [Bacteroidales bacterium]|nr:hypothetical protein [Bacteroidales bacterium]